MTLSRDWVGVFSILLMRVYAGISRLRARPEGFAIALWTASHPQAAIQAQKHERVHPKVSKGRSQTSSVSTALWSRPQTRFPLRESNQFQ